LALKTFKVEFLGYWRERYIENIPNRSGIYCVYECTYDTFSDTVSIHRLIYIGEAGNVKDRIINHEKKPEWKRYVDPGNELCFSFGYVESKNRSRAEAAFIYNHRPLVNTDYVDEFPFPSTAITSKGRTAKLSTNFTIYKSVRTRHKITI
jgi:excinuclease UvrABC nuclease subunit